MLHEDVAESTTNTVTQPDEMHLQHGAIATHLGTRFSLWAPSAANVSIKMDDGQLYDLEALSDGWFTRILPVGTCNYRFVVDARIEVPDPASRAQIDDINGWSRVVDHSHYKWKCNSWKGRPWHEVVFYELHVGILGGFAKVEALLPDLVDLGVTAIELMPLNEFPGGRNWGYDGSFLFAPECAYGTPDQLKKLIDTAHDLGLMVFLDVVYNHFGPAGNHLQEYAKEFFREDIHTPWGAAIDFRKPQVRNFFYENAAMWIKDYRLDGLRFDAVHAINDNDFLTELAKQARAAAPQRQIHLVLENENNSASLLEQSFNAQWNDDAHNIFHALLTGENESYYANYAESQTEKLARYLAEGFIYQGEKNHKGHHRGEPSGHLPPTSFVVFLQNHDQIGNRAYGERLIELADQESIKVAASLLILSPMIPFLFMGEEFGSRQPFLYFTDHPPALAKTVRDGRREEFSDFSLFNDEKEREKIPDPNSLSTFIKSIPNLNATNKNEWRDFYKLLLTLRHNEIVPHLVNARCHSVTILADRAITAAWILGNGSILRINLNLSKVPIEFNTNVGHGREIFSFGYDNTKNSIALPATSIKVTIV